MAKLLHIFYHKEGTFSLLCQQVQLFTHSIFVSLSHAFHVHTQDYKKSHTAKLLRSGQLWSA